MNACVYKLKNDLSKFSRIILWGFRQNNHSHGYIHKAYFDMLNRLGISTYWVDDLLEMNQLVTPGSLVMIPDVHLSGPSKKPLQHYFRKDVYYIFHHGDQMLPENLENTDPSKVIRLYEYRSMFLERFKVGAEITKIRPFVFVNESRRVLIQPWGTDLWPDEFQTPTAPVGQDFYFVGTVWGDPDGIINGNRRKVIELADALMEHGINFHQIAGVTDKENIDLVRKSRVSASIGAIGHAKYSYLQCRTFKNISYGQPTITDVPAFKEILDENFIDFNSWSDGIGKLLALTKNQYIDLAKAQQEKIRCYTYIDMWKNMIEFF